MRDHLDKLDLKNNPVVQVSCNSCKCEQCNFTATKGATSKDHFTNKHGASSKFDCKFCSLTAPLLRNPKIHIAVNHGKITCMQIHYFLTYSLTNLHTEQVHKNLDTIQQPRKNSPFHCDLCGVSFVQPHDLDGHIQRRHVDVVQPDNVCPPNLYNNTTESIHVWCSIFVAWDEIRENQETFKDTIEGRTGTAWVIICREMDSRARILLHDR